MNLDAIVIGAGLSGLVCARRLVQRGANVLVLEARDRVGGRLLSGELAGTIIDLGGQWITPGQRRVEALAAELGIATLVHERAGRARIDEPASSRVAQVRAALAQWLAMRRIDRLPLTDALDALSLADGLAKYAPHPVVRDRLRMHAELVFACDPSALSLLYYLQTLRATGGFTPEGSRAGERRIIGGAQSLATRLAERLGDRVRLQSPVDAIEDTGTGAIARGPGGAYEAKHVVLALPPVMARRLAIELPPPARHHVDRAFAGSVVKIFAAYARPFWRDGGGSGEQYRPRGAVRAIVEVSAMPAILLAFVVGGEAVRWSARPEDERRAEVLAAFGNEQPVAYFEVDWGIDTWSGGCVAGLPPHALAEGARWREPHGRIHFAGTETAREWPGYMEGAIEAGERAAREVS